MGFTETEIDPARFLEDVEMRIGEIVDVEPFPEARKDVYKLDVAFGDETRQSAAGLTDVYDPEDCSGRRSLPSSTSGRSQSPASRASVW